MQRRAVVAVAALLAYAVAAASCTPAPRTHTVQIAGMRFSPEAITVRPGDTVAWVNGDLVPHTVTSRDGALDSGPITAGDTWRWTADAATTRVYVCTLHPTMSATIDVE